jgi:osmotically-inducible protein OsmY
MFKEVGMSRNYEDDRYRDRNYGRREYASRRFGPSSYGRDRDWAEQPSRRFEADDDEQFSGRGRFRERDYDRQYGTGYEPGYGMSGQSRYPNRYRSPHPESRPQFDREYQSGYGDSRRHDRDLDRSRNFAYERDRGDERQPQDRGWWERMSDEVASWFGDEEAERRRRIDEVAAAGNYRGKGPRGYIRSDERIREDINDRLTDYSHLDASDIEVAVNDGAVVLTGWVENRWAKRSAEDIVDTVSGVKDVQNHLRVGSPTSQTRVSNETSQAVDTGSELLGTAGSKARAKGA